MNHKTQYVTLAATLDGVDVEPRDHPHPDPSVGRVVTLDIGRLSLMCGGDTDQGTFDNLTRLIDAATTLRDAADARLRESEAVPA